MSVLIADDNCDSAYSLATVLQLWGCDTRVTYDGISALDMARHSKPDRLLLDIEMPKLHGGEVARELRRRLGVGDVMIVAMSANNSDDSCLAGYTLVFDDFVVKSCDLERLDGLISDCRLHAETCQT